MFRLNLKTGVMEDDGAVDEATGRPIDGVKTDDVPSMTKQAFAEEADINTLVKRFKITGEMPVGVRMPTFGDFTGISDFREALDAIRSAEDSFMAMPAEVRSRFNNDPAAFVEFCSDERNRDEAVKLGLVPAKAVEKAAALVGAQAGAPGVAAASGAPGAAAVKS